VNPANYYESINTLKFGITAGAVQNKIFVNEKNFFEEMNDSKNEEIALLMKKITSLEVIVKYLFFKKLF